MGEETEKGSFVTPSNTEETTVKGSPKTPEDVQGLLFKKLDGIKQAIEEKENGIIHQLCRIADSLEIIVGSIRKDIPKPPASPPPTPQKQQPATGLPPTPSRPPQRPDSSELIEKVKAIFSPDILPMLEFRETQDAVIVEFIQYAGAERWQSAFGAVKALNGRYQPKQDDRPAYFAIKKTNIK